MKRLLLSAAATAVLALPAAALAQTDYNRDHRPAQTQARPAARQNYAPSQRSAPAYRAPATNYRFQAPQNHYAPLPRSGPQAQRPNDFTPHHVVAPSQRGDFGNNYRAQQGQAYDGHNRGANGWNQGGRNWHNGAGWNQSAQRDWRNGDRNWRNGDHDGGWGHGGDWRRGGDWWRDHRGFEGYYGRREGFWYAPGWGYYQPGNSWYGYNWAIGVSVPFALRSYYINDPYDYGLPPAPDGCAWIFLDNQMVLIDLQSGQIVQMAGSY